MIMPGLPVIWRLKCGYGIIFRNFVNQKKEQESDIAERLPDREGLATHRAAAGP
jgi:hypothetical protein